MRSSLFSAATALTVLFIVGCDSPKKTVDTVRNQLTEFKASPDDARQAAVEKSLAKLDMQIASLQKKGDTAQADLFRKQAMSLRADFQAARMARAFNDAKNAVQEIGHAFQNAGKSFSETLDHISKETNQP